MRSAVLTALFFLTCAAFAQQAYVPNMNPVVQIPAPYPDAARSQGWQGVVHLLITLDSQGRVTNAEALTGRPVFRKAALDAVRQWRYPPVIRNGSTVAAITGATVAFAIPGRSMTAADRNISDEVTAIMRLQELELLWPRSPEQVLADLDLQLSK